MIEVGTAIADITPPVGLAMAGFAARTGTATGTHDKLTVRALVMGDTALVTVDVIGIDASLSQRVRSRCQLSDDKVTILATHTHGGPVSMPGRLAAKADPDFIVQLEHAISDAIDQAVATRTAARIFGGNGVDPGYARNRRQTDGPVDKTLPILRFDSPDGTTIAILTSYACHPVVLGADNLHWTADYTHFAREALETAYPGAVAIVATGCAGDVNTGHSAASSLSNKSKPERSFAMAKSVGQGVAQSVTVAEQSELTGGLGSAEVHEKLNFEQRETGSPDKLAEEWRAAATGGDPVARIWASWAENSMGRNIDPLSTRCTALHLCGAQIVAMPGEIFAQTALEIRQSLSSCTPLFILAYADDNPGYIPHNAAYNDGGYEVDEAHRFYGQGATFAPGSAERLADAGCKAARMAAHAATDG